jgi:hypothetical protein
MTALEIPLRLQFSNYKQEIELFGITFNLELEFLEHQNFWILHIYDQEEKPLALGVKLISNWPLFKYKGITFVLLGDSSLTAYKAI